jgi:hypothetical protein
MRHLVPNQQHVSLILITCYIMESAQKFQGVNHGPHLATAEATDRDDHPLLEAKRICDVWPCCSSPERNRK